MTRRGLLQTLSFANPLVWGYISLFPPLIFFRFMGKERLLVLFFAPTLLLASFLAWSRPRWSRWILMILAVFTVFVCTLAFWRIGFSMFPLGSLVIGVYYFFVSLDWTEDVEEELPDDPSEGGTGARERRSRKSIRIAELLEDNDPDELLAVVFKRIVRRYSGNLNVMQLKEHERVFLLAYDAWGIINNGGFNYLFERNILGDPRFEETAAAFAAIGCDVAAEAFAKVFALFPDRRPPEDVRLRLHLYRQGPGVRRGAIDEQFFAADKEIQRLLLAYVQNHREEFTELDRLPPRRRPAKKRKRRPHGDENAGQTAGALVGSLPHWARVAFAARCGRRVWPLFTANWPDARPERKRSITEALELAEMSAASARAADGLEEAAGKALQTAGAAMLAMYGITLEDEEEDEDEPLPQDGNAAIIASFVAKAAEKAAETAFCSPEKSTALALEAFGFARQAAGDPSDLIQRVWQELMQLERVVRRGGWTDQTPVPADVWDLLE